MVKIARYLIILASLLAIPAVGCRENAEPKKTPRRMDAAGRNQDLSPVYEKKAETTQVAQPEEPPVPKTIPEVVMSDELRATCLVNVDDTMPETELTDLDGKTTKLSSLYGPKLTVVCFWTIGDSARSKLTAEAVLKDLMKQVVGPFGEKGVRVLAINVGNDPDEAKKYAAESQATFPVLLDPQGAFHAKIATERKMPRTFLLDVDGKVLWFDLEYSQTASRNLVRGIEVALEK